MIGAAVSRLESMDGTHGGNRAREVVFGGEIIESMGTWVHDAEAKRTGFAGRANGGHGHKIYGWWGGTCGPPLPRHGMLCTVGNWQCSRFGFAVCQCYTDSGHKSSSSTLFRLWNNWLDNNTLFDRE